MLISAGTEDKWNTRDCKLGCCRRYGASRVRPAMVRKSRFTKEFVDAGEYFTLTVLKDATVVLNTSAPSPAVSMDKMQSSWLRRR